MTLSYEGADKDLMALVFEATHHPPTADPTERSFPVFCKASWVLRIWARTQSEGRSIGHLCKTGSKNVQKTRRVRS